MPPAHGMKRLFLGDGLLLLGGWGCRRIDPPDMEVGLTTANFAGSGELHLAAVQPL